MDFRDRTVLELGCGDGRLTLPLAAEAAHVLASARELEVERHAFDIVLFSWSL